MRLYIQDNNKLIKFDLPQKVDGSMLFSFYSSVNDMDNSLNIDSENGKWIIKSNGNINIVADRGSFKEVVELSDYLSLGLSLTNAENYLLLFCLPSIEKETIAYDIGDKTQITIGKDESNDIIYRHYLMKDKQAVLVKEDSSWYVVQSEESKNDPIYVNNQRIFNKTMLYVGDVLFINGIRIVWMGKSIIIPMSTGYYSIKNLKRCEKDLEYDNSKYTIPTELENNIQLYNEKECFSHTPRLREIMEEEVVRIDPPPGKLDKESEMPFILSIGTSFTMLGMSSIYIFNIVNGAVSGTKDFMDLLPGIIMLTTMLTGMILLPIITKKWQKHHNKVKEAERVEKYSEYLETKEKKIKSIIKKQEEICNTNYFDINDCIKMLNNRKREFWNRTIRDDDFCEVRLGIGKKPAKLKVETQEEKFSLEDDKMLDNAIELGKKYKLLENVPITINLKDDIITSLIIQNHKKQEFVDGLLIQLLTRHCPTDLKIAVFSDEDSEYNWDYIKYTSHNSSDDKMFRYFAKNQEEYKLLSQELETIYSERKEKYDEKKKEASETNKEKIDEYELFESYYLIVCDNIKSIKKFKFVEELVENQYNLGFSILIVDKDMKNIPNECRKFVLLNENESIMFNNELTKENTIEYKPEFSTIYNMRSLVSCISNIAVQSKSVSSQLPSMLSFLQMYNVGKIEQINVRNRWKNSSPMTSLQVPIGVHTNGDLFNLDLHEKYDGPHGLIAGSTGSGKSEFIITYILSMALNYDPKEVQFVLIDYKGGGLAGAFENRELNVSIPHLAGTITNLDTAEMNRTLVSIESELKRRQQQFNKVKEETGESTMDIYKYQRLYREGIIDEPISHLFIISDEFAELKAQQPDFMQQLISTARIGRSLGVHLILATQKPSGVVNDQIWSNSKFKVCLKVATRSDSVEMLKRPEAASLKEAGRFYLQVGYDEYFDIGQSAWSGEKYIPTERIVKKVDSTINFIDDLGTIIKKSYDATSKQETTEKDIGDQLTNIVNYLHKISKDDGYIPKKLWLPALDKNVIFDTLLKKYENKIEKNNPLENIVIGEYDAPEKQEQGLLTLDLIHNSNLIVYGISGSGKENIISSMIYYLSNTMSPKDINMYVGDFGSETLKIMDKIPHVGSVFTVEDEEEIDSLYTMIEKELEKRKKEYSEFGGNFVEYNKLSGKKDKYILIFFNNFETYAEAYPRKVDIFNSLFRDGPKYGISFVVTSTQSNIFRSKVSENFYYKACLKMPNPTDYRDVLSSARGFVPADNYGRGIIKISSTECYEFQTANYCEKENRTQFIKNYSKVLIDKYKDIKAKKISILPDVVYVDDVVFELKGLDCVPIGIEKESLDVYVYNFLEQRINLIAAKSIKNHIYFVYALINIMQRIKDVKIHIIDALSIYRGNYKDIDLYSSDNLEKGFITAYNCAKDNKDSKEQHVFILFGISELKRKNAKYNDYFEKLFSQAGNIKNSTFLFFDDSDNYKQIQVEEWFRKNINNTYGLWLGEDIGIQVALGVMSLSPEEKTNVFPCIGYPIYKGRHMIIKYAVDGVDKKDE